jgi:hypothetical protein
MFGLFAPPAFMLGRAFVDPADFSFSSFMLDLPEHIVGGIRALTALQNLVGNDFCLLTIDTF